MKNALNSVKVEKPKTSAFDLTHDHKFSTNMGWLYPTLAMECMPGDRVRIGCEHLVRMAPMLAPMMHRVDVSLHYFFVPNRLVWDGWEDYITNGGDQPTGAGTIPAFPYFNYNDGTVPYAGYSDLMDAMGLPRPDQGTFPALPEKVSAIPFAAYQMIYNEYYRDQNSIDSIPFELTDGNNTLNTALFAMRRRAWNSDYFTRALPFAQKGSPVAIPSQFDDDVPVWRNNDGSLAGSASWNVNPPIQQINIDNLESTDIGIGQDYMYIKKDTEINTLVNDLRTAIRLQEWLEKNARGGTRYSELIRAHFGVTPQDSRLQRPEYIVGIKNPIQISEVLNTTGTDDAPQGAMAGHGIGYSQGNYGKYFATEHGYIIGIFSVVPKTAYQQGIPKHFLKYTNPTELAWPEFANLGEQEIQNRELFAFQGAEGGNTFGYTPRFMEYKTLENRVSGEFRTTLDFWHMGRIFETPPELNVDFIEADPTQRIFSVVAEEDDKLWCQVLHKIMAVRPLPLYGTPSF